MLRTVENPKSRIVALVGPTASGKTSLAIDVASKFECVEVVSIDSMTVYRSMDVGTAKPTSTELGGRPYHMIDVVDPWLEYSVSHFQSGVEEVLKGIRLRGKVPLLVGGTGLYYQAVVDDIKIPGQWPDLRRNLEIEAASSEGVARLYRQLLEIDPVGAAKMQPGNARRIVRALEVTIGTGKPFSGHGPGLFASSDNSVDVIGIRPEREILVDRIERRLDLQLERGWLDEVNNLLGDSRGLSRTARQALGYKELIEVIEREITIDVARSEILSRTKRFSKRQVAWFRRDPRISWFGTADEAKTALVSILNDIESKS